MASDPFSPITHAPQTRNGKKDFSVVLPVPDNAPSPPPHHPTLGEPSQIWTYYDAVGHPLGFVYRFENMDDKEFRPLVLFQDSKGKLVWRWESWPVLRPLYGLNRLAKYPDATVIVTEGEKARDAAQKLLPNYVCITSPNGSKSADKADWSALKGRDIVIWPDADHPGTAYAESVTTCIQAAGGKSITVIAPPAGVKPGWDAADALADGMTEVDLRTMITEAFPVFSKLKTHRKAKNEETLQKEKGRPDQRSALMDIASSCLLWHDPGQEAFISIPIDDHLANYPVRSGFTRSWLTNSSYRQTGYVPNLQTVDDILRVIEIQALTEGEMRPAWLRVGGENGKIYLDLATDDWAVVEITSSGWSIKRSHNLPFIRSKSMKSLPEPEGGYAIEELRRFVNVATDGDFTLIVAWLIAALRNNGPYPILAVNGEQGSGKSTFTRLIRSLIDPNVADIRSASRDERDLIISANNMHVIAMDNLSKVEPWLADALCRIATGGGFSTRALHTDRDEIVTDLSKPAILNGIPFLTERADLAERSIAIRLQTILEDDRQPEDEFWRDWEMVRPRVLGALCDAISDALRRIDAIKLKRYPRMADFAKWATAAESGFGWEPGTIMAAYDANRTEMGNATFEADLVAVAIRDFMQTEPCQSGWKGTATELLAALNDLVPETTRRNRAWPISAQGIGNRFERIAPLLRQKGFQITRHHSGHRFIEIIPVTA